MIERQFHHHRSIVRVQSGSSRGTGFWIKGLDNQLYILTCTHVLQDHAPVEVGLFSDDGTFEKVMPAKVIEQIPVSQGDIALLQVTSKNIPGDVQPLQLLDINFQQPPPFYTFGFPDSFSGHGRPALGSVVGEATSNDKITLLQLKADIDIRRGFSGGPLIHTDLGYVLGMVSDRERPEAQSPEANYYALPSAFIAAKLSAYIQAQTRHPYQAWLASQYHDVVMNDEKGMRLSDIYVEPQYGIHESCVDSEKEPFKSSQTKSGFYSVGESAQQIILEKIEGWFMVQNKIKNPRLTLLFGYPGQGKTSFIKRLLHDRISKFPHKRTYLVHLRYIADTKELRNNPFPLLEKEIVRQASLYLGDAVPEINLFNALLVLDGLDELCIKSDMSSQDIDEICRELERSAQQYPGLRILLSSRYGYVNIERLFDRNILILQLAQFTVEQQNDWLARYNAFHPQCHLNTIKLKNYNELIKFKPLKELITQPILLHMVASLDQDISDSVNRAAIYTKLFDQLVQRPWSREGNIEALRGVRPSMLREAVQDMAHAIYHSEKGYLHKSNLKKLPKVIELQRILDNRLDIWRTVMVAFYIDEVRKSVHRENEDDHEFDYALEFLHKSLPEYLCAEKIWRSIGEEFLESKPKKADYDLNSLYDIFGEKIISREIAQYLNQIIQNDTNLDKEALYSRLTQYFNEFLACDFLPEKGVRNPINIIRANFYGYWTILSNLNPKQNLLDDFTSNERFFRLLKLLTYDQICFEFDLSNQNLRFISMQGANLEGAKLQSTNLEGAKLQGINLQGAKLQGANLQGSYLQVAYLQRAYLEFANLQRASLQRANLEGANLEGAILQSSYLKGAILQGAYLQDAILKDANLQNVALEGAILKGANLEGTKLQGVKGLSLVQLQSVKTLFNCAGIPKELEEQLRQTHPDLFENPNKTD